MDDTLPPPYNPPPPRPPPPPSTPPPIIMPPSASRPSTGRGWKIFALLLLIGLGFSLASNFKHLLGGFVTPGKAVRTREHLLQETTIENNGSHHKLLVIDLDGIITVQLDRGGLNMVELIAEELRIAGKDDDVKAVLLKVNSPGGEVLASDEIYNAIADFQRKTGKPVVASMGTVAASGGYYVSAPCQWIVANELTITGSIGVIMHGYNYRGLMDKIGLRPEVYKSGKFKDMLSGDRKESEIPPEEGEMIQGLIMETYGRFTNVVAQGRREAQSKNKGKGRALNPNWSNYIDGRVFSGKQAWELGFVDEVGNWEAAVTRARTLAGIKDANLIQYQQPFDLGSLFRIFGKTETPAIKVDLGMDFPKLRAGQLYFITPTAFH